MSSSLRRVAGVATAATVLVACGGAGPSATSSAEPEDDVAVTTSPSESPASAAATWSADGASFGVDRTSWPDSMAAAREVLAALPEDVGGEARELMPTEPDDAENDYAGVSYGERLSVLVSDDTFAGEPGAAPEVVGAQAKLAALFGTGFICDPGSYEGTIERHPEFPVPGYAAVKATTPAWFSCRIDGAEGAEDFSAQAVGWTSSKTAWLAVGPDEAAVRELVTALHEAKG